MTYISAQPHYTNKWEDICFDVRPVWLAELLPDYDIKATDRQQIIVGQPEGGRKTIYGIQSADYTIIPNGIIRDVVDKLVQDYKLLIKYTTTGEFSINVILPEIVTVGEESLNRSLILTNSYNGKTPFTIQGQNLIAMFYNISSIFRPLCENGLMGWADTFSSLEEYKGWLKEAVTRKQNKKGLSVNQGERVKEHLSTKRSVRLVGDGIFAQLLEVVSEHLSTRLALTVTVYEHLQKYSLTQQDERFIHTLDLPVQIAKQSLERMRLEERMLNLSASAWLMYNAINYTLFNARSSLTLQDRFRLDEKVFHLLAARVLT